MPVVASSDFNSANGSFRRVGVDLVTRFAYRWMGYVLVPAIGTTAASIDVIIPSQAQGVSDTTGLILPANSHIRQIGFRTTAALTLGASTGKLKLAATLTAATTTLYVESAAAASNTLAAQASYVTTQNITPVTIGGSALTFKLFATDGGAAGAAAASTVTSTGATRTKVLVFVDFEQFPDAPLENEIGYSAIDRI